MQQEPNAAFRALSDPTRRSILTMLRGREMTIAQIAENFDMTRAAVKKHLTVLAEGGLIKVRAEGREKINALDPSGMAPVLDWLGAFDLFWTDRLADLKQAIEKEEK